MVGVGRLRQRDRTRHGESRGAGAEQDTTYALMLRCLVVLHTRLLARMGRRVWGWLVQSLQRGPLQAQQGWCKLEATSRSTSVMKTTSSSTDWNRAAFLDTTCSTRPAMRPVSTSVSRPNWTTNACDGAKAGLCSSWLLMRCLPLARML